MLQGLKEKAMLFSTSSLAVMRAQIKSTLVVGLAVNLFPLRLIKSSVIHVPFRGVYELFLLWFTCLIIDSTGDKGNLEFGRKS